MFLAIADNVADELRDQKSLVVEDDLAPPDVEILRELDRQDAREHMMDFVCYTWPEYQRAAYNEYICEWLDWWIATPRARLMIFTPPRHGKSELSTVRMPPHLMGRFPGCEVVGASYAQDLINDKSYRARLVLQSSEYSELFPDTYIGKEQRGMLQEWHTANGSSFKGVGVGAGITGRGFDFGIIDDPVKDRQEAESATVREAVWRWYKSAFYTRTLPEGRILLNMTRWHQDDLAGRLLEQMRSGDGDSWFVINLPAICKLNKDLIGRSIGDPLWPQKYPIDELKKIRGVLGPYDWASLYEGEPVPPGGEKIQRDWFKTTLLAPKGIQWVRFWDLAVSKNKSAHWTASIAMGREKTSSNIIKYYLKDLISGQWEWPQVRRIMLTACKLDGPSVRVGIEEAGQQKGFISDVKAMREFRPYSIQGYRVDGDKLTRALPWIAQAEGGNVYLVMGRWNGGFLDICQHFTGLGGERDDEIDAVSGAWRMLEGVPGKTHVRLAIA